MTEHYRGSYERAQSEITVRLVGEAESTAGDELQVLLDQMHAEALAHQSTRVIVDLGELSFATSSFLKVLFSWVMSVVEEPAYRIKLVPGAAHAWQKRSLAAITAIAGGILD